MSFVRVKKSHPAGLPRKQKVHRKKPAWDDTIQDLTALKATPEEIEQRKASHRSKNALAARLEKHKKANAAKQNLSISTAEARQLAVMKEVLYDQQQLHDVLSKSDKMMAVVKDIFGDDPRRFTGFPNVTSAPNAENSGRSGTIVANLPDIKTRMETLSESMMDQSALNDFPDTESDEEEEMEPIMYQPKIDLNRFQRFLEAEEKNNTLSTISGQAHLSHMDQGPIQSTRIQDTQSLQTTQNDECHTPPKQHNESIEILRSPKSAMNDTQKIKKTKRRVEPEATQHNSTFNLNELKKVLVQLENEIGDLETQTGRRPRAEQPRQDTFSGYTMSLVDSVTKLSRYLKESEMRLKAEALLREQLMQDVKQLTSLIDALTSDIIHTQEEFNTMRTEYSKYRQETSQEIRALKVSLVNAGLYIEPELQVNRTPPTSQSTHSTVSSGMPVPNISENSQPSIPAIPQHLNPANLANPSAVLLSPPVRKTRVQQPQQQTGPLPMMDLGQHFEEPVQPTQPQHNGSLQQHGNLDISDLAHPDVFHEPTMVSKTIQEVRVSSGREEHRHPIQSNVSIPQDPRGSVTQGATSQDNGSSSGSSQTANQAAHVSVPRPTPLVQSTVPPQQNGQVDLTSQIAQLNKQHEEAQKRLHALLQQQQMQHKQREMAPQLGPYKLAVSASSHPPPLQISKNSAPSGGMPHTQQVPKRFTQQQQMPARVSEPENEKTQPPSNKRGLPAYPVSPPISPISERSDNFATIQGMNQNARVNTAPPYGITVSLPTVDLSLESSPSPR
ncbi:spindle and centriole-associated protein 1-like isoform X1 [Saccostrea echinata]|uniref:spindle and centriole-associated protein 1-like isoform X1 n=1 Tax=Saccostrea echinata TaxID=191078 RepID=UPI002A806773|nr:spindle and centriole-associated protein 1-like isoform X1 [Saccostrea echinata]